jgi:hypothetical protein
MNGYALLSENTRKARKEHRCIWCPEKILKGESYLDERSVYDGAMQNHHWHPECRSAASKFFYETCEEEFMAHECKRGTSEPA